MEGYLGCVSETGSMNAFIHCDECDYDFDSEQCKGFRERTNRLLGFMIRG